MITRGFIAQILAISRNAEEPEFRFTYTSNSYGSYALAFGGTCTKA